MNGKDTKISFERIGDSKIQHIIGILNLDFVVAAKIEVEGVVSVNAVLQSQDSAHLVDDVVAGLIETPPELLGEMQLETGLLDGVADRQAVAQVGLGVEGVVAAKRVTEGSLRHDTPAHFPLSELRGERDERLDTMTVVEELILAVVVVEEAVRHPDLHPLLPKSIVGSDSELGAVVMGEIAVEPQLALRRDMPSLEDFVVILRPHDAARLERLGPRAHAHPKDRAEEYDGFF